MRPSFDCGVLRFSTNFITSALPHQFQCRRLVSKVTLWNRTSLTVPPSWTLIPNTLFESLTTMLENTTCRMSAWVSVPIIIGVDDDPRMLFVTRTFSTGRTGRPGDGSSASVFRQMESSAVTMVESEIVTFDEDTMSIPSEFTPRSRSEKRWIPRTHTRSQSCRRTFQRGAFRMVTPFDAHVLRLLQDEQVLLHVAGAVVALHLHARPPRDLLLFGDLDVHAFHGLVGPLRRSVERSAARDGDVPGAPRVHERAPARRPVRAVVADPDDGPRLQPQLHVVLHPDRPADVLAGRHIRDAAALRRTHVDGGLDPGRPRLADGAEVLGAGRRSEQQEGQEEAAGRPRERDQRRDSR